MAYNGTGTFNRIYNWTTDAANGINIEAARMDTEDNGFATGLSNAITKDGQTTITADIPFSSKKITALANGSARTDSIALGQVQDGTYRTLGTLGGSADTYTASPSPAITTYTTGSEFNLKVNADNTGASTLNVSAIDPKDIKKYDGAGAVVDLEAGDLQQDQYHKVIYDGTDFILLNPEIVDNLKSNNLTINNKLNTQPNTATISSGAITYTGAYMVVDTEGAAATDDLDTISGGVAGDVVIIRSTNDARNVVLKHNTAGANNLNLTNGRDITLGVARDKVVLIRNSNGFWEEVTHSTDSDFANSKSTNGYTYLPNGLIFQWGNASVSSGATVTLPVTFPNNIFNAGVTHHKTSVSGAESVALTSTSQITIYHSAGGTETYLWTAIGR